MGPGGIAPGSYLPHILSQEQRQWLWNYFGHSGTAPVGYGGEGSAGGEFDYAAEAQKAYGELGAYYDRVLREAEGDVNKALARLTQDYERGARIKREDLGIQREQIDRSEQLTKESARNNALARGLYQQSAFDEFGGFGLADTEAARRLEPIALQRRTLDLGEDRYTEEADIQRQRREEDLKLDLERKKFNLEQQRRKEAANLANLRGQQAAQTRQLYTPTYV